MAKKGSFKKGDRWYQATEGLTDADISGLVEIREDNTKIIQQALGDSIIIALEKIGLSCEGFAKKLCPVDTGRLRNSITHILDDGDKAVIVGTNVEYARYVELGTIKHKEQPFLKPAAEDHRSLWRKILEGELQK